MADTTAEQNEGKTEQPSEVTDGENGSELLTKETAMKVEEPAAAEEAGATEEIEVRLVKVWKTNYYALS